MEKILLNISAYGTKRLEKTFIKFHEYRESENEKLV